MKEILGDVKTIRALSSGAKYSIDYYQRGYRWEAKQIEELISDLAVRVVPGDEHAMGQRTPADPATTAWGALMPIGGGYPGQQVGARRILAEDALAIVRWAAAGVAKHVRVDPAAEVDGSCQVVRDQPGPTGADPKEAVYGQPPSMHTIGGAASATTLA